MGKVQCLVLLSLLVLYVLDGNCEDRTERRISSKGQHKTHPKPDQCCEAPCSCDSSPVKTKFYSYRMDQEVGDRTVLRCTPGSYFSTISYIGIYNMNTTCYGIEHTIDTSGFTIYNGTTVSGGKIISLKSNSYEEVITSTNGNVQISERATINGGECDGDQLWAASDYVSNNPLEGCCEPTLQVNSLAAASYKLKIFGKCCSTCYLHSSNIQYKRGINNTADWYNDHDLRLFIGVVLGF